MLLCNVKICFFKPGWKGIIATPEFWPECGCYYLDFWYHAYGAAVAEMMVMQEGYETPLWNQTVISKDEWVHIRRDFKTDHPTRVFIYYTIAHNNM